jgi:hypothetical protein
MITIILEEDEGQYLIRLMTADIQRMIHLSDHAASHGARGFVCYDGKTARGTLAKFNAAVNSTAYEAGVASKPGEPLVLPSPKIKCDGDHGGDYCGDPECWLREEGSGYQ